MAFSCAVMLRLCLNVEVVQYTRNMRNKPDVTLDRSYKKKHEKRQLAVPIWEWAITNPLCTRALLTNIKMIFSIGDNFCMYRTKNFNEAHVDQMHPYPYMALRTLFYFFLISCSLLERN